MIDNGAADAARNGCHHNRHRGLRKKAIIDRNIHTAGMPTIQATFNVGIVAPAGIEW